MMKLSKTFKPFVVITVPFPFTDSAQTKKRPAVVISSEQYQSKTGHISLLMVTSAKHSNWYNDHPINDLTSAGLVAPCVVRQKLFTIDHQLVIQKIGVLSKKDQEKIKHLLNQHLCF